MYATKHAKVSVKSLSITILQDRGFLSEPEIAGNTKFINYTKESTKTGLGSSAGAIVVTVGAVIRQFLGEAHKNIINALSQIANLAAQNKIGSNFDISTAVYGSHLYKNILPKMAYETTSTLDFQKLLSIDP
jgi:phosphomevalonate kinase